MNCSFVARGFSGERNHLAQIIGEGIRNRGFAFIDILQPCVSFNKVNTFQWYKERVYNILDDVAYEHSDRIQAFQRAQEWGEKIPIGVIYRTKRPCLNDLQPAITEIPLVKQKYDPASFEKIFKTFT